VKLRPYQQEAVDSIHREFAAGKVSTLVVLPTGCGKTVVFSHVIKDRSSLGRSLVIAHRDELIRQAADKIGQVTGEAPDIEMADEWADRSRFFTSRCVVASKDTLHPARLRRFSPQNFLTIVTDEAHHAIAKSYGRLYDHFRCGEQWVNPVLDSTALVQDKDKGRGGQGPTQTRHLGVTATPDRTDEAALGRIFQSVAYVYEIEQAIRDGWLVDIRQQSVVVKGLDFSSIRTTAGDLNGADLAALMEYEENLHKVASPLLELSGTRKTLVFCVSVAHAERLAEILNRHKKGSARWVCGTTPVDERKQTLRDYRAGEFQYLCNVGVFTEGFDEPGIEIVAIARPTKSRALYAQMVGRGTRPLPGLVDGIEDADGRRQAIDESPKRHLEVIDFEGNSGRHKLVCVADILGGEYEDEIVEKAAKAVRESGASKSMLDELAKAKQEREERLERERAEYAARRAKLTAKAEYSTETIDPFAALDIRRPFVRGWDRINPATDKQAEMLKRNGIDPTKLCKREASALIDGIMKSRAQAPCSQKQANVLRRYGYDTSRMTFKQAHGLIDEIAKNGWRRVPDDLPAEVGAA
jgi:superfamily II DNA or RNA helicase